MKPLRNRLLETRKHLGLPWEILERDYLLSWILAGINHVDALRETLISKGGTALKKCYFGDYRFSEDLDFSSVGSIPRGDEMEMAVKEVCAVAQKLLDEYAPVEITCERYAERDPHPTGQEAFNIRARFPWHGRSQARAVIEIATDEKILKPVSERTVIHEYGEPLKMKVKVYSLEEIVAEKMRAILQHQERLKERGWGRSRARDYYDLWRILTVYRDRLALDDFLEFLRKKCALKSVAFNSADDFFQENMLTHVERTWNEWLGPLVPNLPSFNTVMTDLRPRIKALLSS